MTDFDRDQPDLSNWQQQDEEERLHDLLDALQKVDRAGLRDEALLLAYEGGVLNEFRKQQET